MRKISKKINSRTLTLPVAVTTSSHTGSKEKMNAHNNSINRAPDKFPGNSLHIFTGGEGSVSSMADALRGTT
jgi:hypothetical protein